MEKQKTESVPVTLTDDELILKAKELSANQEQYAQLEEEKKQSANDFATRLKFMAADIGRLARIVSTSVEYRNVIVKEFLDYERLTVTVIRTDTGEQIEVRAMNYEERQRLPMLEQ